MDLPRCWCFQDVEDDLSDDVSDDEEGEAGAWVVAW
jgi:hypothetical protein